MDYDDLKIIKFYRNICKPLKNKETIKDEDITRKFGFLKLN